MNIIGINRFKAFCKQINYPISIELENAELEILSESIDNSDSPLIFRITFFNAVSLNEFIKFNDCVKSNKALNIQLRFIFSDMQYTKDILLQYIDKLIYKKAKWGNLSKLNMESVISSVSTNGEVLLVHDNIDFENEYSPLFEKLKVKLQSYGFQKINFTFVKKDINPNIEFKTESEWIADKKDVIKKLLEENKKPIQSDDFKYESKLNKYKQKNNYTSRKKVYKSTTIKQLRYFDERSAVSFCGEIYSVEKSITDDSPFPIYTIKLGDYEDALTCSWYTRDFLPKEQQDLLNSWEGTWIKVEGSLPNKERMERNLFVYIDNIFPTMPTIKLKKENYNSELKRIELHASTKMNVMDSVLEPGDLVSKASEYGMRAVGIIDTDGVQAFPAFYLKAKKKKVKPIFGVALSTVSKNNRSILGPIPTGNLKDYEYVSFDIETTGLSPKFHELIEFGSVLINDAFKKADKNQFFIKINSELSDFTVELTGITDNMLEQDGIDIKKALYKIYDLLNNKIAIAHNARFDYNFLKEQFRIHNVPFPNVTVVDTLIASRIAFPNNARHKLEDVANRLGVKYDPSVAHRGDYDAEVLADVWIQIISFLNTRNIFTFEDLANFREDNLYAREFSYEMTAIALNENGIKEMYGLVTDCLTKHFINKPITFVEDLVQANRNNILLGSGTLKGRLLDKYFYSCHDDFINELNKYDVIEIPAPQAFEHWVVDGFITKEQLEQGLKEIITCANLDGKITIATADTKYIEEIDKLEYDVLVYSKGIGKAHHYLYNYEKAKNNKLTIPKFDFLTTQEMLDQFAFLNDKQLIEDLVINSTNKIVDKVENIEIIKDKLFTPNFDDSSNKLSKLVYENAHKRYGDILPEIIAKRIESELNPIIKYGFDVIYWISYKLVQKSYKEGYIVGSRGSVGSSFIATLIDVSEVNPLEPHYNCSNCKYLEFVHKEGITSGFDLEDKLCPKCGTNMRGDGQSIPFETFLGFNADKVPDIDLNFSGIFQPEVHDEVKRLFGDSHTLRAGTIAKIADKTAYGYVKAYCEEARKEYSSSFIDFLSHKIAGVKRTTGQHPGGIIIIPKEYDVFDFTPVNYPANETNSSWLTSHFDYRSIHDNVLKLDILGHDNPTIIKMLEKYTGLNIKDVPKNDPRVLSLFYSLEELKIKPESISGELTGALGLPEYGTSFVRQLLRQAHPTSFADLISVCGLSHGTNVWLHNAQNLILKEGLTLKQVISCRDDIMIMLIDQGVDRLFAFNVMEKVRKGKGLNEEEVAKLKEHNVPEWQIDSMQKIEYMFPKAHAVAYATMAWWIAWFKLYYPLAHYACYFATHAKALDISAMIDKRYGGKVSKRLYELNKMSNSERTNKDTVLIPVLEIAEEMYARGFYISNIDIEKSLSHEWIIDEERKCLIPPFDSIDGLGESIANSIVENREIKPYRSKEDFKARSGINKTLLEKMDDLGVFKAISDTDQFKLF
ncbi:PolC-type DNA polymerase III [Mycoplasmopsis felifaucium]|uniref:PolC-type DNA polymerase III n=1 Tax=Mycoplasmopsis felifaucium TaxID=35768 RepID=UPI000480CF28|nr:PolC-type DNA polymerase III [Mycoplasmopsis felifaucium]